MKRLFILTVSVTVLLTSCGNQNAKWEENHESNKVVHVCGSIEGPSPDVMGIALSGSDYFHGKDWFRIKVRNGGFAEDVPLNDGQAYELFAFEDRRLGQSTIKYFFADRDTIRLNFVYGPDKKDLRRFVPENVSGNTLQHHQYLVAIDSVFKNETLAYNSYYDSVRGSTLSQEYLDLLAALDDRKLDERTEDSLRIVQQMMMANGEHLTPEGTKAKEMGDQLSRLKLDYTWNQLVSSEPTLANFQILATSLGTENQLEGDFSRWIRLYQEEYEKRFPDCILHQKVQSVINSRAIREGVPFIDFTLPDKDGKDQTFSQLISGKVAVLEFWATWCGPCIANRRALKEIYQRYYDQDFTVVCVAREFKDNREWLAFIDKEGDSWPDLISLGKDHSIGTVDYGLGNAAGGSFLIDKDGTILKINPTEEDIEAAMAKYALRTQ